MGKRNPLLVLFAAVVGLCAGIAGFSLGSAPSHGLAVPPAELSAPDAPSKIGPALTRGGFAMAAVDSSRRKLRSPQRPPEKSSILTGRSKAEAPARAERRWQPAPDLPPEPARAHRPFAARGPPV